jgi:sodium-dependent dicarboxylate transporter 2/3/5
VGGGASLAIAIADTGLAQKILGGIPWDQFSFAIIIIIFIIAGAFFTTFMSNTASANIILPLVFSVVGIHYVPVAVATALAISASMSLPVSTPPNALAYSSGKIQLKDMVTAGFIITVASVILIFFSAYLVWPNLIGAFSR